MTSYTVHPHCSLLFQHLTVFFFFFTGKLGAVNIHCQEEMLDLCLYIINSTENLLCIKQGIDLQLLWCFNFELKDFGVGWKIQNVEFAALAPHPLSVLLISRKLCFQCCLNAKEVSQQKSLPQWACFTSVCVTLDMALIRLLCESTWGKTGLSTFSCWLGPRTLMLPHRVPCHWPCHSDVMHGGLRT